MCPTTAIRVLCMTTACAANWTLHPSIHPNLQLCNSSAKHGTIQAHRLGELPSPVEPRAFLLDMVINADFDQGFLVISIVGRSGWNFVSQCPNWIATNDPDSSEHMTCVRLASSWSDYLSTDQKRKGIPWPACVCNKCVYSLGGHNWFSNYIKMSRGFHSALQCLLE